MASVSQGQSSAAPSKPIRTTTLRNWVCSTTTPTPAANDAPAAPTGNQRGSTWRRSDATSASTREVTTEQNMIAAWLGERLDAAIAKAKLVKARSTSSRRPIAQVASAYVIVKYGAEKTPISNFGRMMIAKMEISLAAKICAGVMVRVRQSAVYALGLSACTNAKIATDNASASAGPSRPFSEKRAASISVAMNSPWLANEASQNRPFVRRSRKIT